MDKLQFVYVTYIATTPEKLWKALTSAEFTRQYWGARSIHSEWKEGSVVRMTRKDGDTDWEGKVLEIDKHRLLSYTFHTPHDTTPTKVTFEISKTEKLVKLTVKHTDFPSAEEGIKYYEGISRGWHPIISSLKTLLETGKPLAFKGWE